jgi:hypothetical protein
MSRRSRRPGASAHYVRHQATAWFTCNQIVFTDRIAIIGVDCEMRQT